MNMNMTENEKKLLQAKHRLEEAQMDLTKLENFLYWALR